LFSSKPKGYAIAGLLVGFPGVLFFFFVGMSMLLGFLGIGAAGMATVAEAQRQVELQDVTTALETEAEAAGSEAELLEPLASDAEVAELTASDEDDVAEPAEAVADIEPTQAQIETQPEPAVAPEVRTFSDASGRFSVEATLLAVKDGKAKLKREDNGKELVVEISKLSQADQEWINSWNLE
jgi:cytoskeletal protein RodZ